MGTRDVIANDIYQKEQLLFQLEDDYRAWRNKQEQRQEELYHRSNLLHRVIEQEQERGMDILRRFGVSYQEGAPFFRELEWFLQDSEQHHRRLQQEMEWEKEEARSDFYRQQRLVEEEMDQLRRQYASTDE